MRRWLSAALEMLACWLWPEGRDYKPLPFWSVVWSDGAAEDASRDVGTGPTCEAALELMYDEAPAMVDRYGGTVYVVNPDGKVHLSYAGRDRGRTCWLTRLRNCSPN